MPRMRGKTLFSLHIVKKIIKKEVRDMRKRIIGVFLLTILSLTWFTACNDSGGEYKVIKEDVMIKNEAGTYTKAQVIAPSDFKETSHPLITLSHGFRGSMNTAGGDVLAENLAKAGFATIRMNYSHYKDKAKGKKINQYTVDTMISDQLLCIDYMIKNYNVDKEKIGLYGRSLGGRVAMIMANENRGGYDYKALALIAPAGNKNALQYYMGGEKTWQKMKAAAKENGSVHHQGVVLTPEFFKSIEDNNPCDTGKDFQHPVLVIYNTEDYVVLPETSLECAKTYEDVQITEVTSKKSPHGYEMSFEKSNLKDQLTAELIQFFQVNL